LHSPGASLQPQSPDGVVAVAFSPDGKTIRAGNKVGTVRLWETPATVSGDGERILLWTQVMTGMELDENGMAMALDAKTWLERRDRLQKRGGPPLP
jgi:WD40 repeat protein